MLNTKTNQLADDLANTINAAQLPPCVVGLVLDKLRWQVPSWSVRRSGKRPRQKRKRNHPLPPRPSKTGPNGRKGTYL